MADGQRLRRWQQEEEQAQSAREATERVAVTPSPLLPETAASYPVKAEKEHFESQDDTWAELEAEALRRSQMKIEDAESLYLDKAAALVAHRQHLRAMWAVPIMAVIMSLMLPTTSYWQMPELHQYTTPLSFYSPLIGALVGQVVTLPICFLFLNRYGRWLENRVEPTARLSLQGIYLCTPQYPDVMLFWNDIVSVKAKGFRGSRYLELRDTQKRRFVVHESYLPCSVEVLAARIADYRCTSKIA